MVWDLRTALLRKEEFESARLTDCEFRAMIRAMRLTAAALDVAAGPLLGELAEHGEPAALAWLAGEADRDIAVVDDLYSKSRAEARRQFIAERGDPSPVRLG